MIWCRSDFFSNLVRRHIYKLYASAALHFRIWSNSNSLTVKTSWLWRLVDFSTDTLCGTVLSKNVFKPVSSCVNSARINHNKHHALISLRNKRSANQRTYELLGSCHRLYYKTQSRSCLQLIVWRALIPLEPRLPNYRPVSTYDWSPSRQFIETTSPDFYLPTWRWGQ